MKDRSRDEDDEPETTRLPRRPEDDDDEAPITLRSPESGIVLVSREPQVTVAGS